jgi:UDP-glucose 4-epimerase
MRCVVTGSAGHLGEALCRTLRARGDEVVGIDLLESRFTSRIGSVADADFVRESVRGTDVVFHTATLHKPHVVTHSRRDFVDSNVSGTLAVLEASLEARVSAVVFTSTTSVFGAAMRPGESEPAAWVTEDVVPVPQNIYGVTKLAAEELCQLFYRTKGLPVLVLRTSRFFREIDDDAALRAGYDDLNVKVNEYLYRRLDLADAVDAHLLAAERAGAIGFGRYVVSATSPFRPEHVAALRADAPAVLRDVCPGYLHTYEQRGWSMLPGLDRVYVNARARDELGWRPRFDFGHVLSRLEAGQDIYSELALDVGIKGYHAHAFEDGPYPVETRDETDD